MIEKRTVSQCTSSEYCKGWNDAVDRILHGNETLERAIDEYGIPAQINVCIEELSELIKELCKINRSLGNADNLAEEMADVTIILREFELMFNNGEAVDEWINKKIERLKARLDEDIEKTI